MLPRFFVSNEKSVSEVAMVAGSDQIRDRNIHGGPQQIALDQGRWCAGGPGTASLAG